MELAAFEACVDVCEDEASFFVKQTSDFLTVSKFCAKVVSQNFAVF